MGGKKEGGEYQALGVAETWEMLQHNLLAMCDPFHGHAWLTVPFLRTARKKPINSTEQFPPPQRMIALSG